MQSLQREFPQAKLAHHTVEAACCPMTFYNVISDYEAYPEFVPTQRSARVTTAERTPHLDRFQVEMALSLVKPIRYELSAHGVPGRSLHWELVRGDFMRVNSGGWEIEDLGDGTTRATMYMAVVLKGWLPKSVINSLVHKTCPATVRAFKEEAERRATM